MDGPHHPGGCGVTADLLALLWAVVLGAAVLAWWPSRPAGPPSDRHRPRSRSRIVEGVAGRLGSLAVTAAARAVGRAPPAPVDPAALGAGLAAGAFVVAVAPGWWPSALVVGALPPLLARLRRSRSGAAVARAVLDELPEVIDLLGLAVGAGLTAPLAVAAVGRRGGGRLAAALAETTGAAARDGRRLADVLDDVPGRLGQAGDAARPLLAALADAARHGTALGPSLERLAAEARTARRHRAEERARRVPILLLFPLVTCTLPALGLLTIAPLAVGALRDLRA